jgi:hypothetical protein
MIVAGFELSFFAFARSGFVTFRQYTCKSLASTSMYDWSFLHGDLRKRSDVDPSISPEPVDSAYTDEAMAAAMVKRKKMARTFTLRTEKKNWPRETDCPNTVQWQTEERRVTTPRAKSRPTSAFVTRRPEMPTTAKTHAKTPSPRRSGYETRASVWKRDTIGTEGPIVSTQSSCCSGIFEGAYQS